MIGFRSRKDMLVSIGFLGVCIALAFAGVWAWKQYITRPPYVNEERYPIRGIDISSHNGELNLDSAASSGIKFVFIKASEGVNFQDENFEENYDKAGHAGLRRGAYHFFRFERDGVAQAQNFLKTIGNRKLELGIAIDVEDQGNLTGIPDEQIQTHLGQMVEYLNLKGYRVMLYTNRDGYEKYLMENYPGMPLWICSFSSRPVDAEWTFWQYNHHGKVAGIPGDVDLNAFCGSEKDWAHYPG